MKQVLAGLGLLAGAGIATVALAPAGNAQGAGGTWAELEATWSPNPASPGEAITLTPSEACGLDEEPGLKAGGDEVLLYFDGASESVSTPMADDGSWEYEVAAENAPTEPGVYKVVAECRNDVWLEEIGYCDADENRLPPGVTWDEEEEMFVLASYSKPAAPTWKFDCVFEYYTAELTVEGDTPPTTMPPAVPPPATPVEDEPPFTG